MEKELKVSAIKNGTVIDRIPSDSLFKVINILGLENCKNQITFGTNLDSKHLGKKAIIKVTDLYFETKDIDRIALVAPTAKLNVIRDYEVVEKRLVSPPELVENILRCINPKCITNHEEVHTKFTLISLNPLEYKCRYCENHIDKDHFEIK